MLGCFSFASKRRPDVVAQSSRREVSRCVICKGRLERVNLFFRRPALAAALQVLLYFARVDQVIPPGSACSVATHLRAGETFNLGIMWISHDSLSNSASVK